MTSAPGRRVRVEGDMFHGRIPAGAKYVGRRMPGLPASKFNNPHTLPTKKRPYCRACSEVHEDREDLVYNYRRHLRDHPELVEQARVELAGWDLACWCKDGECHVDVLLEVVAGKPPLDLGPLITPCRLCAEQGRTFDGEGLPIFKRILPGGVQSCIICDGTTMPDYRLLWV